MLHATEKIRKVWRFYYEGFREMTVGRTLWMIILVKLAIMFGVLKLFFFPDFLSDKGDDEASRAEYVRQEFITR